MLLPGNDMVPMRVSGEVLRASLGIPQLASAALTSACPGTDENQMARIDWHVLWTKWQRYGESQYGSKWGIPWDVYKPTIFILWLIKFVNGKYEIFGVPQFHIWQYLKENGNTAIIWDPYGCKNSETWKLHWGKYEKPFEFPWTLLWICQADPVAGAGWRPSQLTGSDGSPIPIILPILAILYRGFIWE